MTTQDSTSSTSSTPPTSDGMRQHPADTIPGDISATSPHDNTHAATPAETGQRKRRRTGGNKPESINRYMAAHYDRMELQLIAGDKSRLQAAAAALDMSPTALIIAAVNAYTAAETLTTKARNPYI